MSTTTRWSNRINCGWFLRWFDLGVFDLHTVWLGAFWQFGDPCVSLGSCIFNWFYSLVYYIVLGWVASGRMVADTSSLLGTVPNAALRRFYTAASLRRSYVSPSPMPCCLPTWQMKCIGPPPPALNRQTIPRSPQPSPKDPQKRGSVKRKAQHLTEVTPRLTFSSTM